MAYLLIEDTTLQEICDAIRKKSQTSESIKVSDFAAKILDIQAFSDYYLKRFASDTIPKGKVLEFLDITTIISDSAKYDFIDPGYTGINDTVKSGFALGNLSISKISDGCSVSGVVYMHSISTGKSASYTFDSDYVTSDEEFALRDTYTYESTEETIDSGSLYSVKIITSDKASVENMEVATNG